VQGRNKKAGVACIGKCQTMKNMGRIKKDPGPEASRVIGHQHPTNRRLNQGGSWDFARKPYDAPQWKRKEENKRTKTLNQKTLWGLLKRREKNNRSRSARHASKSQKEKAPCIDTHSLRRRIAYKARTKAGKCRRTS